MANHLTPSELADEMRMKRQDVIGMCVERGVPVLLGRSDKTVLACSLRSEVRKSGGTQRAGELSL